MTNTDILIGIGATVISMLMAGNIYFIKRLIDRIESTGEKASGALRGVEEQAITLREIKSEIKDLRRLEIDVAVLKSSMNFRIQSRMGENKSTAS